MNRFKTSKFKNTTPKIAKKDGWINNVRAGSFPCQGSHIKASSKLVAFNTEQAGGGMLGLSSVKPGSDGQWTVTQISCHSDLVTDLDFSPFDESLLATCSGDETVKLWRLCDPEQQQPSSPDLTLRPGQGRLELVLFHPTSSGLLAVGATKSPLIWDTSRQDAPLAVLEQHGDQLQSLSWKRDGSLLASSCKDKMLRVFDPRAQLTPVQSAKSLQNNKDSRILWARDDFLLTTGFDMMRSREVRLWDSRKLNSSVSSMSLGTSSGMVIPLFDDDTGLLILAGMGEAVIDCVEVSASEPFFSQVSHCLTDTSSRGVALVPKHALDVLSCEVMRVLQLTDSCIVPISYQVPRKQSSQEFHEDLYPDTVGTTPVMSAEEWWKGGNKQVEKVSLHPDKQPKSKAAPAKKKELASRGSKEDPARGCSTSSSPLSTPSSSAAPSRSPSSTSGLSSGFLPSPSQSTKAIQSLLGPTSKFRHIQGAVMHRDTHITNLRGLNLTTPGESDGFCVNRQRVAVPLAISGGQIAVCERSQPGRLPDTALPTVQNSVNVVDLSWDPFDTQRLVVAGDDAKIRVWQVPEGGLKETLTEPEVLLQGHTEKIYSIEFHPLASGLLASSSYDLTVRLWNLENGEQVKLLTGHQDQIFCMAWSPDGKLLATVCKDGKVRIYDPRKSTAPVQEGPGPEGHRGARVVWVCEGKYLFVSGFDSRSERILSLYSADSVSSGAIACTNIDTSPSTLIPFYDPDTGVVILSAKGDTRVHIYEIVTEEPYFIECSSYNSPEPHKGLAFLPKSECNVRDVEIAVGLIITKTAIEPVAFRVPRVKKEFFQDDVYIDTAVCWEPALTASAWLSGSNGQHKKISLKPKDMTPVSEAPKEAPVRKYLPSSVYLEEKTDEQKKEELLSAMVAKLGNMDDPLPQDSFQGVDEDEWDD
ncbi:coronin-7 [Cebidichthys violaceus]|uniref:coronin-7 n=1 Tax=Cebidichthys violaceus TaxID=271503 RepID=UPI0035CC9F54